MEEKFQRLLLEWYEENKRSMPWREDPTPYHIWISEIMLQQTRVEAVREYYKRFLERIPDVKSLAEVDDEVLNKLWEGLGYYNRAKNLKKAASCLEKEYGGRLPSCYDELLKLPGIGPYTAGAIASIAFHEPVPAVDGNVMRVISRITGDDRDITERETKKAMEKVVQKLIPKEKVSSFNQALMELGALVCIPNGKPKCESCPVRELCFACEKGKQEELPVKKGKKERRIEKRTILIFQNGRREFYLKKRDEKGLLAGLWEFPSFEGNYGKKDLEDRLEEEGILFEKIKKLEKSKHIFSHIEWDMMGYLVIVETRNSLMEFGVEEKKAYEEKRAEMRKEAWASFSEIKEKYSIPSAFGSYMKWLEKNIGEGC